MEGAASSGRAMRRAARGLAAGLSAAVVVTGCATKNDLKQLRDEVVQMQVRQDSLFLEMQRQNRVLLDTLRSSFSMQLDAQGQTSHRFRELEQQVGRTEEILYQLQTLVAQLMDRLNEPVQAAPAGTAVPPGGSREAADAYQTGIEKMAEESWVVARLAFETVVNQFGNDPLAPHAQFQLAETWVAEGDTAMALAELEKVERIWSQSDRAPEALIRAGTLAEEIGDVEAARTYYGQVTSRYPGTPAYRIAQQRLREIGR